MSTAGTIERRIDPDGRLQIRFVRWLSGIWDLQGDHIRHRVDSESSGGTTGVTAYAIMSEQDVLGKPATVLRLRRQIGLGGQVFAFRHGAVEDPTVSGVVPRGRL